MDAPSRDSNSGLPASRHATVCSAPHPGVISTGRGRGKNAFTDSLYFSNTFSFDFDKFLQSLSGSF
jgi:hypothetical protein